VGWYAPKDRGITRMNKDPKEDPINRRLCIVEEDIRSLDKLHAEVNRKLQRLSIEVEEVKDRTATLEARFNAIHPPVFACKKCGRALRSKDKSACTFCGARQ